MKPSGKKVYLVLAMLGRSPLSVFLPASCLLLGAITRKVAQLLHEMQTATCPSGTDTKRRCLALEAFSLCILCWRRGFLCGPTMLPLGGSILSLHKHKHTAETATRHRARSANLSRLSTPCTIRRSGASSRLPSKHGDMHGTCTAQCVIIDR